MVLGKFMDKSNHRWIIDSIRHRRIVLFWAAVLVFLPLPWILKGCALPTIQTSQSLNNCSVKSIHDGDTMTVNCDGQRMKVRLYCIDAPEIGQRPWGQVSRDYLRSITPEQVEVVVKTTDRYGRAVGEVMTTDEAGMSLNLTMVVSGQAAVYTKFCTEQQYVQAEHEARKANSGIWEKLGLHQRPWAYRANKR
jgi:endonuclease YncB( thermonuclease family)